MTETIARVVVRLLADAGVRTAYTVPGESFLPLLDELEAEPRIRLVSTRHESGAAFMAEAEGKLTGRPTLALASRGPGAANLAIGVHTAHQDQTPLEPIGTPGAGQALRTRGDARPERRSRQRAENLCTVVER